MFKARNVHALCSALLVDMLTEALKTSIRRCVERSFATSAVSTHVGMNCWLKFKILYQVVLMFLHYYGCTGSTHTFDWQVREVLVQLVIESDWIAAFG